MFLLVTLDCSQTAPKQLRILLAHCNSSSGLSRTGERNHEISKVLGRNMRPPVFVHKCSLACENPDSRKHGSFQGLSIPSHLLCSKLKGDA